MAEDKKSFVAYADWLEDFEMLSDEEAGKLIKHLLLYVNDKNPIMEDRLLKFAFQPIKRQLKRDLEKYEKVRQKRIEAGKKGGRPKAKKANGFSEKQSKAKKPVNVNGNVTVNVNDNVLSKKRETRALDFMKTNFPSRWETDFLMKYKKQIKDPKKFAQDFNDTVDMEKLEYDQDILFGRLGKWSRNWIERQNKYSKTNENQNTNPAPEYF